MADKNPTWSEVFARAFLVMLGRHRVTVTAQELILTVSAVAPLHGIPTGYNRRSDEYKIKRAQKWLDDESSKIKLTQHSHLEQAFIVDTYGAGGNFYDTSFGAWHLCGSELGGLGWQRLGTPNGQVALQCVAQNEEKLIRSLLSFAIQSNCATTVPIPQAPYRGPAQQNRIIYNNPNRLILTSRSETRFNKGGECRSVDGLPPGVALLFLNDPENTGLLLIDEGDHGRRRYGMVVIPGSVYALQLTQPGFEPLEKVVRVV